MISERQGNKNNKVRKEIVLQREHFTLFSWREFNSILEQMSQHTKHYSHQAFAMRIWQKDAPFSR